jgi:hypothetical protein
LRGFLLRRKAAQVGSLCIANVAKM